jgi:hypothetical protein
MKTATMPAWMGALALLCAGFLWAPRPAKAADGVESMQTIKLLADAKTMAVQLKDDAAKMQQFGQLDIKWEAHCGAVAKMREHVAAMNGMVEQLKAAEATAVPWEKAVIDRVGPYMTALATDNEDVMDEFDLHPSLFGTAAAKAYLAANAESTTYLSALVKNVMENGTLRQTIQDYDEQEDGCGLIGVTYREFRVAS